MSDTTTEALVTIRAAVEAGRVAEERHLVLMERLRLAEAERDAERAQANEWLTQLHDARKEIERLKWIQAGSPMSGETPLGE